MLNVNCMNEIVMSIVSVNEDFHYAFYEQEYCVVAV